jgi:hypothetical protein
MSGLPRWKENRIRQEIHLAHLKHAKTSSNGAGVDGTYPPGRHEESWREKRPDKDEITLSEVERIRL